MQHGSSCGLSSGLSASWAARRSRLRAILLRNQVGNSPLHHLLHICCIPLLYPSIVHHRLLLMLLLLERQVVWTVSCHMMWPGTLQILHPRVGGICMLWQLWQMLLLLLIRQLRRSSSDRGSGRRHMTLPKLIIIRIGLHALRRVGGGVGVGLLHWRRRRHLVRRLCYVFVGTHQMEDVMLLIDILVAAYHFRQLLFVAQQFSRIYQLLVINFLQKITSCNKD